MSGGVMLYWQQTPRLQLQAAQALGDGQPDQGAGNVRALLGVGP
jgi:hypothetical protein